jgi:hypothetical protein
MLKPLFVTLLGLAACGCLSSEADIEAEEIPEDAYALSPAAYGGCAGVLTTVGGYNGWRCAGTLLVPAQLGGDPNNSIEYFVIGTPPSNNIFHIWRGYGTGTPWSGWQTVPGFGTALPDYNIKIISYSTLQIQVHGTDGHYYCNKKTGAQVGPGSGQAWSGWWVC